MLLHAHTRRTVAQQPRVFSRANLPCVGLVSQRCRPRRSVDYGSTAKERVALLERKLSGAQADLERMQTDLASERRARAVAQQRAEQAAAAVASEKPTPAAASALAALRADMLGGGS